MSPLGTYLVETLITLTGVICLAVLVLWGGRRLGLGRSTGPLELLGKLPLDPRRAVYLVRVGRLVYVVAASEGGLVRLGEVEAADVPPTTGRPRGLGEELASMLNPPNAPKQGRGAACEVKARAPATVSEADRWGCGVAPPESPTEESGQYGAAAAASSEYAPEASPAGGGANSTCTETSTTDDSESMPAAGAPSGPAFRRVLHQVRNALGAQGSEDPRDDKK